MHVLLLTQHTELPGGIANYFKSLKNKFQKNLYYFITGSRDADEHKVGMVWRLFSDYIKYTRIVRDYDLIHLNTSLRVKSVFRDGLFLLLSRAFFKRVVLFIHGWDSQLERILENRFLSLYRSVFFKANAIIVLSNDFEEKLRRWGYGRPIFLLTTVVDDDLMQGVSENDIMQKSERPGKINILYLSRLEKEKGLYETIDAYSLLKKDYPNVRLTIAGDGSQVDPLHNYIQSQGLNDVSFIGFVTDGAKKQAYLQADVFCFPTFYGEGMPTNVLEAMAFGLPVVTRYAGGIRDFFKNGEMGYATEECTPKVFASLLEKIVLDKQLRKKISLFNYRYAHRHFLSSKVVTELESIYERVLTSAS
jgi:glycosyltransferase involved in cell wall biosynthesis